ncbi:MAG TPA: Arm DNA-binding domain-containing protein [Steroidobacteraceae bacterium]|nr:Arm DNA-binding domain-containing protein [Steroidobacteraceae bacterium]
MLTEAELQAIRPLRYSRKISNGGGLHLLVTPKGTRCWRYAYRFAQKCKTFALGFYPDVPLNLARSRHYFARNLLARGLDPSALKAALGKHVFVVTMWEWEVAQEQMSAIAPRSHVRGRIEISRT